MFIDYKIGRQSRLPGHAGNAGGGREPQRNGKKL